MKTNRVSSELMGAKIGQESHGMVVETESFGLKVGSEDMGFSSEALRAGDPVDESVSYWVWGDGVWVEWGDGEVAEQ